MGAQKWPRGLLQFEGRPQEGTSKLDLEKYERFREVKNGVGGIQAEEATCKQKAQRCDKVGCIHGEE